MSHTWQKILVAPTATMEETISVIDKGALKFCISRKYASRATRCSD